MAKLSAVVGHSGTTLLCPGGCGYRRWLTQTVEYDPAAPHVSDVLIDGGKVLNDANVPTTIRRAVADTILIVLFQKDPLFVQADQVGDDGTALREARIGRKRGFDNYMTQNIRDGGVQARGVHPGHPNVAVAAGHRRRTGRGCVVRGCWPAGDLRLRHVQETGRGVD